MLDKVYTGPLDVEVEVLDKEGGFVPMVSFQWFNCDRGYLVDENQKSKSMDINGENDNVKSSIEDTIYV